jgi:hypothetical protein
MTSMSEVVHFYVSHFPLHYNQLFAQTPRLPSGLETTTPKTSKAINEVNNGSFKKSNWEPLPSPQVSNNRKTSTPCLTFH